MKPAKIRRLLTNASNAELPIAIETSEGETVGHVWHIGPDHVELSAGSDLRWVDYTSITWIGLAI